MEGRAPSPVERGNLIQLKSPQILLQRTAQIIPLECKLHRRLQKAQLVPSIVALAFINVGVHLFLL